MKKRYRNTQDRRKIAWLKYCFIFLGIILFYVFILTMPVSVDLVG